MLLVRCPNCKHNMKTMPVKDISKSRKVCVYCGKSFKVKESIIKMMKT